MEFITRVNNYISSRDRLYKYTSIAYIPSSLENGIFAGKIENLNDPYEFKDIVNRDNYHICALSFSRDSNLMWAHYANSHKGCSIQICNGDYVSFNSILKKVKYQNYYINRSILSSEQDIVESLYYKEKKWKYEHEIRAVYNRLFFDPKLWKLVGDEVFLNARIIKIKFGCMADVDSDEYFDALRAIYLYNRNHPFKEQIIVQKMKMKDDEYRFIIDQSYSFESELNRLGISDKSAIAS